MIVAWLRIITLLLSGFALGLTFTIGYLYVKVHTHGVMRHVPVYFVPAIGAAHALLIIVIDGELIRHVYKHEPFVWWFTPAILPALVLSIYAQLSLLTSDHLRGLGASVHGR